MTTSGAQAKCLLLILKTALRYMLLLGSKFTLPLSLCLTENLTFRIGTGERGDIMREQEKACSSPGPFAYDPMEAVKALGKTKKTICYDVTRADHHFHQMIERFVKRG